MKFFNEQIALLLRKSYEPKIVVKMPNKDFMSFGGPTIFLQMPMSSEWRRGKRKVQTRSSNRSASPLNLFAFKLNAVTEKNFDDSRVSKSPKRGYRIGTPVLVQSHLKEDE